MKIVILGSSGTGKTTICQKLGKKLQIPYLHLDSVYWKKDWANISKEEFDVFMKQYLLKHSSWVIDGNYMNNKHFKYRMDAADIIVVLDFGRQVSLQGIHERAKKWKHQVRPDMAEGCKEGIDQVFLQYVAFFHKQRVKKIKAYVNQYKNKKQVLVFKTRQELYNWYNAL